MIINPLIDILTISFIMSIVSQTLRRKFAHPKEMKKNQKKMKKLTEKQKELMKKNDSKSKKELEELEKELLESINKMMGKSMKMMLFSMAIFLPVFFVLGQIYAKSIITLPFPIPWFIKPMPLFGLFKGNFGIMFYNETSWLGWYIFCSFIIGISLNIIIGLIEKMKSGEVHA